MYSGTITNVGVHLPQLPKCIQQSLCNIKGLTSERNLRLRINQILSDDHYGQPNVKGVQCDYVLLHNVAVCFAIVTLSLFIHARNMELHCIRPL